MNKYFKVIFTICCIISAVNSFAQKDDLLSIKEGKMVLRIKTNISQKSLDSILQKINMMQISMDSLRQKQLNKSYVLDGWEIISSAKDFIEISKSLSKQSHQFDINKPYVVNGNQNSSEFDHTYYPEARFGFNSFRNKISVKPIGNTGKTRFLLYSKLKSNQVYLSGSFNAWATEDIKMIKTDTAWYCDINISPGKYYYKFIVDGEWFADPENRMREDDTYSGFNSIYFACNYTFALPNNETAKKVILTGSFNEWNERDAVMYKQNDKWILPVYIEDGNYQYKFIVDKKWITDPKCNTNIDDGYGNINSTMSIGAPTLFTLNAFGYAKEVYLAGDFNNWRRNEIKLRNENNQWKCLYVLAPGNYQYKFVVDGNWVEDPRGTMKVVQPNHTFKLMGYSNAKDVRVSGSFVNWISPAIPMLKQDSSWVFNVHLNPGKHTYKFIVDGQWILDPANPLYENNEYDTGNSLLWFDDKNRKIK